MFFQPGKQVDIILNPKTGWSFLPLELVFQVFEHKLILPSKGAKPPSVIVVVIFLIAS